MTVVDASVWVAALVARDVHHTLTRDWLYAQFAAHATLAVPALALPEVAGAITRRTGSGEIGRSATEWMLHITSLRIVGLDADLAQDAVTIACRSSLRGARSE